MINDSKTTKRETFKMTNLDYIQISKDYIWCNHKTNNIWKKTRYYSFVAYIMSLDEIFFPAMDDY